MSQPKFPKVVQLFIFNELHLINDEGGPFLKASYFNIDHEHYKEPVINYRLYAYTFSSIKLILEISKQNSDRLRRYVFIVFNE